MEMIKGRGNHQAFIDPVKRDYRADKLSTRCQPLRLIDKFSLSLKADPGCASDCPLHQPPPDGCNHLWQLSDRDMDR